MTLIILLAAAWLVTPGCSQIDGPNFSGKWQSAHVTLEIARNGENYIVKASNPAGLANGTFAAPYKDGQIAIGAPMVGNITCSKEGDHLFWGGEEFSRVPAK